MNPKTPRTKADYDECKRLYYEQQLRIGKGFPRPQRGGPIYDINAPESTHDSCCFGELAILILTVTFLLIAAAHASPVHLVSSTRAAVLCEISTPSYASGPSNQRPALPSAITSAVRTVNVACELAAAHVKCPKCQGATPSALVAFIAAANPNIDATYVAQLLSEAGESSGIDSWLLACLARFESNFDITDVGGAGERGLLQIHPCHKRAMRRAGLDFYSEADRLTFACMMIEARGLKPWAVRRRAMKLYEELSNGE